MKDPKPVQEPEVEMFSPGPSHVTNLTPDEPQSFKDHSELIAEKEAEAREHLAKVAWEYGQWVANQVITTDDGLVIYPMNAPVPDANVKLHGYDKLGFVDKVVK